MVIDCNLNAIFFVYIICLFKFQIHCHNVDSNTLDEFFSKDLLPNEYGGKAGAIEDIRQGWMERIIENR